MLKKISVMVLGLRGFPMVQGGVETHAENLYAELAQMGCEVEVLVRDRSQPLENPPVWKGIRFTRLWAPRGKRFEAIAHTLFGVIYAAWKRPDVLHIHAIGPALLTPLARLFGLNVVVTHHGADYERQKSQSSSCALANVSACALRTSASSSRRSSAVRLPASMRARAY
jgi:glycosyltransferase involved in cell wall biosynthesis